MSGFVKIFKVKDGEKDKTIWIKIEDLNNTELNTLPAYDDKHLKNKIRT